MADYCIRAGATGAGTGLNWTDAYASFAAAGLHANYGTGPRGNTYYVADGSYDGVNFRNAVSGELYITIKKATESAHGPSEGWSSAYGDGVAEWTTPTAGNYIWLVDCDYITIDGVTGGGPGLWTSGHGFRMEYTVTDHFIAFIQIADKYGANWPRNNVSHVNISHLEIEGYRTPGQANAIDASIVGYTVSDVHLSYLYVHEVGWLHIQQYGATVTNWTVEYCCFHGNATDADHHGICIRIDSATNYIVRHNIFSDMTGTGWVGLYTGNMTGVHFYGNAFFHTSGYPDSVGNGAICDISGSAGYTFNGVYIYNNTFYNLSTDNIVQIAYGTLVDAYAYNNLTVDCDDPTKYVGPTAGYNTDWTETEHPFTDPDGRDFTLTESINNCTTLAYPYNTDMDGVTRGADGTWDAGALEYEEGMTLPVLDASRYYWRIRCKDVNGVISSWSPSGVNYFQTILACTGAIELPAPTVDGSTSALPTNWEFTGGITLPAVTVAGAAKLGHNCTGAIVLGTVEVEGGGTYRIIYCEGAITLSPVVVRGGPDDYGKGKSQQYVQWRLASRAWRYRR